MATTKITQLTAYTDPVATDVLPIVDVAADSTKKIEVQNLCGAVGNGTEAAPAIAFANNSDAGIYRPGANQIAVSTRGTNRLTLDSTSSVNTFLRLSSDCVGIQFKGRTDSDDTLDDYDQGTFTPTIEGTTTAGSATYTTQTGIYTKIGNQVSFVLEVEWAFHTGQGDMRVTDLPFTSKATVYQPVSALAHALTLDTSTFNNPATFHAMVIPNSTTIQLYKCLTEVAAKDDLTMDADGIIYLAGTYLASS